MLDVSPTEHGLQESLPRLDQVAQTLRDTAANINPLLTVEVDQVLADDSTMLRIAVSCNQDPENIESMQGLVAAAPTIPSCILICAFSRPTPSLSTRDAAVPRHTVTKYLNANRARRCGGAVVRWCDFFHGDG